MPGMYSHDELDNINREQMEDGPELDEDLDLDTDEELDDEDYEDDGQPDEAQEWHDFDPDC